MLLNIIHPYTFKLQGDGLQIGPCEEYEERDKRITSYVKTILDSGATVLHHKHYLGQGLRQVMHDVALKVDPLYEILFDTRVKTVVTTPYGTPFLDEKPAAVSRDEWEHFRKEYTSHSELQELVGSHNPIVFIGGVLENCVANAAAYFHLHYRKQGQELFYIPELCVSLDVKSLARVKPQLEGMNINFLSYEKALMIISRPASALRRA